MNQQVQISPLFAEPFCVIQDAIPEDMRKILISKVKKYSKKWKGYGEDAWSSGKKSPTNSFGMDAEFRSVKEFKELASLVLHNCEQVAKGLGMPEFDWRVSNGWYNSYDKNNYQEFHVHPMSYFSIIYFCKLPKGSAPVIFMNSTQEYNNISDASNDCFKSKIDIEFPQNSMLIFRSHVLHKVPFGTNNEDRITFSFNVLPQPIFPNYA